jgi:hypothetical protein
LIQLSAWNHFRQVRLMGERWSDRSFVFADYKGRAQSVLDSDFLVYALQLQPETRNANRCTSRDSIMQLQGVSAASRGSNAEPSHLKPKT